MRQYSALQASSVRLLMGVVPFNISVIVDGQTPKARPAAALEYFIVRNQRVNSLRVIYAYSRKSSLSSELVLRFLGIMALVCENVKTQQGSYTHFLSRSACFGR